MQRIIISLISCLLPAIALANSLTLRNDAPDRYVVAPGDTLWGISSKFFTDPWKWPEIWGANQGFIKNPHWIYPGDVIVLDRKANSLKVQGDQRTPAAVNTTPSDVIILPPLGTLMPPGTSAQQAPLAPPAPPPSPPERMSPQIRTVPSEHGAISGIPLAQLKLFLQRPLVVEKKDAMNNAPMIVAGVDDRTLISNHDIAYVKRLPAGNANAMWQVYRPGKPLVDPENGKTLGYAAQYLGDASVEKSAEVSTVRISNAQQEIMPGDRLMQAPADFPASFTPRAPDNKIQARIISINNSATLLGGKQAVVVINKGQSQGLQVGHVLALYRPQETIKDPKGDATNLPLTRYGLLMVFRTFTNVSYATVMETTLPVEMQDLAQTP